MTSNVQLDRLDHLVLTVRDIEATCDFYTRILGMEVVIFGQGRTSLRFGAQKINLHQVGREFEPKARNPGPGTADLCFLTLVPLPEVIRHLQSCDIEIVAGPANRTGTIGPIRSVYMYDPDGNLIEISNSLS
jgi:catechol 2,3-dioxygenase-like lactoylglutathione lyase family enzyme